MMKKETRLSVILIFLAAAVSLAVPLCTLFEAGSYLWCNFGDPVTHEEWLEIAILSAVSAGIFFGIKDTRWKIAAAVTITLVFCYIHVTLLPFVVSALYFGGILLMGGFVRGTSLVILCECILSIFKVGDSSHLRITVAMLFLCGAIVYVKKNGRPDLKRFFSVQLTKQESLMFAIVFVVFLIQAGRLNGTVDFDSQWYGVRSDHVLAPTEGIYQDFGLLGMVYTYSKGFEVLGLPLTGFRSYGYVLFFNVWIFLYGLYITYGLAKKYAGENAGVPAVILTAFIPAIVNMSVAAKPDIITWVLQLIMIKEFLSLIRNDEPASVFRIGSAFLLSLTMKPTAIVFSTALFGMMLVFLLCECIRKKDATVLKWKTTSGNIITLVLTFLALAGIWGRTVLLTGLPFTSVFSKLLSSLGFNLRYPFPLKALPQNYQDRSVFAVLADRIGHMLLSPTGKDMRHVIIAWGGSLIFFMLMIIVLLIGRTFFRNSKAENRAKEEQKLTAAATMVFIPFTITSLVALSILYQVDGNYFIALYSIIILSFVKTIAATKTEVLKKTVSVALLPILVLQFLIMTTTNWASYTGFTPFRLNKGSYNHVSENKEYFDYARRAGDTWNILLKEPEAKVIAFAEHPACLKLPAVTQSFDDTFDSWGNPDVVYSSRTYIDYMKFQSTDYVYVDPDYFAGDAHQRAKKILDEIMEKGLLTEVTGDYAKLYRVELP